MCKHKIYVAYCLTSRVLLGFMIYVEITLITNPGRTFIDTHRYTHDTHTNKQVNNIHTTMHIRIHQIAYHGLIVFLEIVFAATAIVACQVVPAFQQEL